MIHDRMGELNQTKRIYNDRERIESGEMRACIEAFRDPSRKFKMAM